MHDDVASNYQTRYFAVNSISEISAGEFADAIVSVVWKTGANEFTIVRGGNTCPQVLARSAGWVTSGDDITFLIGNVLWKSASNVTKISIKEMGNQAVIGAGSRIILYKLNTGE